MNLFKLSYKSLAARPLFTALNLLLLGLSTALIVVSGRLEESVSQNTDAVAAPVDMVVGAKGSPLQLVLSSVLHLDAPTGNIDYHQALQIAQNRLVKTAVPISYGDNYQGFRIVGTTHEFEDLYQAGIREGQRFEKVFEITLGARVARESGLKIGDQIVSSHGLVASSVEQHEHDKMTVTGIYEPVNAVFDNLIFTPLESIWDLHASHEHEHEQDEHEHHEHHHPKEITSLLLTFKSPMGFVQMPRRINADTPFQAALPRYELERLFGFTAVGIQALGVVAWVVLIFSFLSIFVTMFKMVRERYYELALMRTYGSSRTRVVGIVLLEGLLIGFIGCLLGILAGNLALQALFGYVQRELNFSIAPGWFHLNDLYLLISVLVFSCLTVLLAVRPIFKMDVSKVFERST